MSTCPHLNTSLSAPTWNQTVHREECTQCFDSQDSATGVDVCLRCFYGGCPSSSASGHKHAYHHFQKRDESHALFVNIQRRLKKEAAATANPNGRPDEEPPLKKLAIRAEASESEKYDKFTTIKCYACDPAGRNLSGVPGVEQLDTVVQGILSSSSSAQQSEVQAWEEEITSCTHVDNLEQVPPKTLEPAGLATCQSCDLTSNLWLCLTCGALGCGRQQFGGVGGHGHALSHSDQTGHPVALKLGTVDPGEGTADLYCYTCNDPKIDPKLQAHLANFGMQVEAQQKTEKSMTELQVEQNLKFDFAMTGADGAELEPLFGAGLTGLRNLGNSCYMNSSLQALFDLPVFKQRYFSNPEVKSHALVCTKSDPADCLECQLVKIADGLLSGRYAVPRQTVQAGVPDDEAERQSKFQEGIKPDMFKRIIGKDHEEFKTMRQQDADEFFKHLLKKIEQLERSSTSSTSSADGSTTDVFKFGLEHRLQCTECKGVKYRAEQSDSLSLPVPANEIPNAMDTDEGQEKQKKSYEPVPLEQTLDLFLGSETELEYKCPNCDKMVKAVQTTRLSSFPDVLLLHMTRFQLVNWVPQKLEVPVTITKESVSLDNYLSSGQQPGETLLPDVDEPAAAGSGLPEFDPTAMAQLSAMGFPEVRCQKALLATGNSDAEAAMNWLFAHMEDQDIDDPIQPSASAAGGGGASSVDEGAISMVAEMGFSPAQARKALRETSGSVERAVEWLFSHPDDQGEEADAAPTSATPAEPKSYGSTSVPADYELRAFLSHKGPSVHSGHYVAHVKKPDVGWVLFNDEKVVKADAGEQAADRLAPQAYVYLFVKKP